VSLKTIAVLVHGVFCNCVILFEVEFDLPQMGIGLSVISPKPGKLQSWKAGKYGKLQFLLVKYTLDW
jgi:hypothetical protein